MKKSNLELSAKNKLIEICENLKSEGFVNSEIKKKQFNYETTSTKNKQKIKVQVYFGKKGVKTVIQGNSLSKEYSEVKNIISGNLSLSFEALPQENYDNYIGTDETGKGDFFGPLVIAGIYVEKEIQDYLVKIGVRDSKELNDPKINELARIIKKKFPNHYSIISIGPEKYNQLYEGFKNINKILDWGHSKVIENILGNFNTENVIIDQFSKKPISISLKLNYSKINFIQTPKAEKFVGVAAASILARNQMNIWFKTKKEEGFSLPKGASSEVETYAKEMVKNFGKEILLKLSKNHFKTTKKISEN